MNQLPLFIKKFIDKINQFDKIALFCHIQPDFDAYGSVFALYHWIMDNYHTKTNQKQVRMMLDFGAMSSQEQILFKPQTHESFGDEQLGECLGIILDTANSNRVLTQKHLLCQELICIDHHPQLEAMAPLSYVDPLLPACSQILHNIFLFLEPDYLYTTKVAQYLYAGIITDTNYLLSSMVLDETFGAISNIISRGINRDLVHDAIFLKTINQKKMEAHILKKLNVTHNGLGFVIVNKRKCLKYCSDHNTSYLVNNLIQNIMNVEVWVWLVYEPQINKWKASIRSKNIEINQIAHEFGGGGHKKMAAIIFNQKKDFFKLLIRLESFLIQLGYRNCSLQCLTTYHWESLVYGWYRLKLKLA